MNECLNLTLIESRSISPRFDVATRIQSLTPEKLTT